MKRALLLLAALSLFFLAEGANAQETSTSSKPKAQIAPTLRCHFSRKNRSFCKVFPNFSRRHNICDPTLLGHIEWCREDITVTDRDECGNYETYEAVTITYRTVYENGAWGEKFQRTYRKEPSLITPPLLVKTSSK